MILASLPIGRQRRYDLFLAAVPVVLLVALVASSVKGISFYLAVATSAVVAGLVLLIGTAYHPPGGTEDG